MFNHHVRLGAPSHNIAMRIDRRILVVSLLSVWTLPSFSAEKELKQTASVELNVAQIVKKIEAYQQRNEVFDKQQYMVEANVQQVKRWQNPRLVVQQIGLQNTQDKELTVSITQELDVFGQRQKAAKIAQLDAEKLKLHQQSYQAQLQLLIKHLVSQVLVLQEEHEISQQQLNSSLAQLEAAQGRFEAGSIAQLTVEHVRLTHLNNQRQTQQVALALKMAKQQLAQLWGETASSYQLQHQQDSLWPSLTEESLKSAFDHNVRLKSQSLQGLQQQATVDYLQAKAKPNPSLVLGVTRTQNAALNTQENQMIVGVEIPLTLFNRQQSAIQIASHQNNLLQQQGGFYQQYQQTRISHLVTWLRSLQAQYQVVLTQQMPLAQTVYDKTLLGFKVGKYAMTDVQQAMMQLQTQRLEKITLLKQAWQFSLEAESLALGIDINTIRSPDALLNIQSYVWSFGQDLSANAVEVQ